MALEWDDEIQSEKSGSQVDKRPILLCLPGLGGGSKNNYILSLTR